MSAPPTDEELHAQIDRGLKGNEEWTIAGRLALDTLLKRLRASHASLAHERSQPSTGDRERARRCRAALAGVVALADLAGAVGMGAIVMRDAGDDDWVSAISVARDLLIDTETREDEELPPSVVALQKLHQTYFDNIVAHLRRGAGSGCAVDAILWLRTARLGGQRPGR